MSEEIPPSEPPKPKKKPVAPGGGRKPRAEGEILPQYAQFIEFYLQHGNGKKAAMQAGYSEYNASWQASRILRTPAVQKILEERRKAVQDKIGYSLEKAMKEAERSMELAEETQNATAHVKAVELRAKLNALLIERHDVRALTNFKINIVGIPEAKPVGILSNVPVPILPPSTNQEES